ncbi:hypothetical protein B0H17DRAFT_1128766 [Mycena rosella]|uniref:Uncharacterized protein n=1 Tax=Mycena rosella TaxID=1033263 RepID=A0AAD7DXM8_MYCRO|nr:hypothetical protein B0H17DRAFT_1128766 [Mycena rosella]
MQWSCVETNIGVQILSKSSDRNDDTVNRRFGDYAMGRINVEVKIGARLEPIIVLGFGAHLTGGVDLDHGGDHGTPLAARRGGCRGPNVARSLILQPGWQALSSNPADTYRRAKMRAVTLASGTRSTRTRYRVMALNSRLPRRYAPENGGPAPAERLAVVLSPQTTPSSQDSSSALDFADAVDYPSSITGEFWQIIE